jgi:molybdopterin synthase catalytic subunit
MAFPTILSITEKEIDLNDLLAKITQPTTGAAAIFTGMVRGTTVGGNPHKTDHLEYEAYQPMAEAKMKQVAEEIRNGQRLRALRLSNVLANFILKLRRS